MTAVELAEAYREGRLSPAEVTETVLAATACDSLNAFCARDPDAARAAAEASALRWREGRPLGPLDGVPVSIKDNIYVDGMPTRFGSLGIAEAATRGPDSPAVARLREAGAILHGKTTLPDYAHKIVTDSPLTGVTRNPVDPERTPGGSSGGAAASVGSGIEPIALGSDGGGSVRVPAAWSGVFGFKPGHGRVPHHPRGAFAPLSHVGPLSRTVTDAALAMSVITRPDARDWYAQPWRAIDYEAELAGGLRGWRVAFSPTLGLDIEVEPDIAAAVRAAAAVFVGLGCEVEEVDPPLVGECAEVQGRHWIAFSALLAERLGTAPRG